MNHYTILSISCITIAILLAFVSLVVEPKKKSAAWYLIIILICILVPLAFIFLILHNREEIKKNKEDSNIRKINRVIASSLSPESNQTLPSRKEVYDVPKSTSKKDFIQPERAPPDSRAGNLWYSRSNIQNIQNIQKRNNLQPKLNNISNRRINNIRNRPISDFPYPSETIYNGSYETL